MKYMLLIYDVEKEWNALTETERQEIYAEYGQLRAELSANGKFLDGSQLQPTHVSSNVRVRNGKPLITDGPFAETHEQLGGYILVEARDLKEANSIAAKIPTARMGRIEVRPLVERAVPTSA